MAFLTLCLVQCINVDAQKYDFIVAKDGSGQFTTVQEAINAVPDYRKAGPTRILIKKGVYKEKVHQCCISVARRYNTSRRHFHVAKFLNNRT